MTNSWMNADGEPIMDGAAWRFEQQLDMESAQERYMEDFYDNDYDGDWEECSACDSGLIDPTDGLCIDCGAHAGDEPVVMEDQWLDGSYEE